MKKRLKGKFQCLDFIVLCGRRVGFCRLSWGMEGMKGEGKETYGQGRRRGYQTLAGSNPREFRCRLSLSSGWYEGRKVKHSYIPILCLISCDNIILTRFIIESVKGVYAISIA